MKLIAGEKVKFNPDIFQNDMTTFNSADDVLTLLVHLGYLTYNDNMAWVPNSEVAQEFINSIEDGGWEEVMRSVRASDELLKATLACDEEKVAELIEQSLQDNTSILKYNDENSLSCTINLAFYFAKEYYTVVRELPSGKGFADICFIPRKLHLDKPAAVIELKWNKSVDGAIGQIRDQQYCEALKDYHGDLLLVGINYDKKTKTHECVIEKFQKK